MLEIQIGFQRSNTSLYSFTCAEKKEQPFAAHHLNLGRGAKKIKTRKYLGKRMNSLVSTCTDQTLKKFK